MKLTELPIEVDTHTHTILSGHAWSTLQEMAAGAATKRLSGICITDHAPSLPGSLYTEFSPQAYDAMPRHIDGVRVFYGCELNILEGGKLDMREKYLRHLQYGIASLHEIVWRADNPAVHTEAALAALGCPYIDAIGHPGNPNYGVDPDALVAETKRLDKLVEINNHSFAVRKGSAGHCLKIAELCKKRAVRIVVSSDAHSAFHLGVFCTALEALESIRFPAELILNKSLADFEAYVQQRRQRLPQLE